MNHKNEEDKGSPFSIIIKLPDYHSLNFDPS